MRKVKTGIKNMDRLLGGGIPEKTMILLKGEPGAGKSNMGLEFLYRGAEKGQTGLYVSFQENAEQITRAITFDWDFEKHVKSGRINISKFDPYRFEELADTLRSRLKQNNADRVVLDPITDLDLYINSRKDVRKNLISVRDELRDMDSTTLLVAETEEATEIEEEIADGIISMEVNRNEGRIKREIFVRKIRGSDYNHGVHNYIFENNGIKIQ